MKPRGSCVNAQDIAAACKRHSLFTWSAQSKVEPLTMVSSSGATFQCSDGKEYLDLVAQSMSASVGHQHPKVIAALKDQLDTPVSYTHLTLPTKRIV